MNKEGYRTEIDLLQLARMLLENVKYIMIATVIMGVIGFVGSKVLVTPIYEASAKMIVNTRHDDNQNVTNDQLNSAKNLVDTYAIIIRSRDVLNRVSDELNLSESYGQLASCVSVHAVNNTQVMQVKVQHENRETALAIAAKILEVAPSVIVETVEAGSVKPVEQAYAGTGTISPSAVKNGVLLAAVGFILSCCVVVIVFLSDNTYKTDLDIQNELELPVLGVIPTIESCGGRTKYKKGYPAQGKE